MAANARRLAIPRRVAALLLACWAMASCTRASTTLCHGEMHSIARRARLRSGPRRVNRHAQRNCGWAQQQDACTPGIRLPRRSVPGHSLAVNARWPVHSGGPARAGLRGRGRGGPARVASRWLCRWRRRLEPGERQQLHQLEPWPRYSPASRLLLPEADVASCAVEDVALDSTGTRVAVLCSTTDVADDRATRAYSTTRLGCPLPLTR
jgi:hypothetical protein